MKVRLHQWKRFPLRRLAIWRDNLDIWGDFRDLKGWHCRRCGSSIIASKRPGRIGGRLHTFYSIKEGLTWKDIMSRKWYRSSRKGRRLVADVKLDCNMTMVRRIMKR